MKRKILNVLFAALCLISITGCKMKTQEKSKDDPDYVINENRTTDGYKYDWKDFMNINIYGSNGVAYVEVVEKEISASDFESDSDYIKIKSIIEKLNLNYVADGSNNTELNVSPDKNLSEGDVITFSLDSNSSIQSSAEEIGLNLQDYEYRVSTLSTANRLDMFDSSNVTFYALEGTNEVYYTYPAGTKFTDEMKENLIYEIKTSSSEDELEADKTVLTATVSMDANFLKQDNLPGIEQYLSKYGYEAESYSEQIVLHNIAKPINFETMRRDKIVSALYEKIKDAEIDENDGISNLNQICSVHKLSRDASDEYLLYVVYQDVNANGETNYYRRGFRAVQLDDEVIIIRLNNADYASEEYATNPYDGGEIVLNNMIVEESSEESEESEPVESEESVETTENNE